MPAPASAFDRSFRHSTTSSGPVASRKASRASTIAADAHDHQMSLGRGRAGRRVDIGQSDLVGVADRHLQPRVARRVAQDDGVLLAVVDQGHIGRKRTVDVGQVDGKHALETGERSPRFFGDLDLAVGPGDGGGDVCCMARRPAPRPPPPCRSARRGPECRPTAAPGVRSSGRLRQAAGRPQQVGQQRRGLAAIAGSADSCSGISCSSASSGWSRSSSTRANCSCTRHPADVVRNS